MYIGIVGYYFESVGEGVDVVRVFVWRSGLGNLYFGYIFMRLGRAKMKMSCCIFYGVCGCV